MNNIGEFISICDHRGFPYLRHEPMYKHTSFRIGGPAQMMVFATGDAMLQEVQHHCHALSIPLYMIGNGSNLLVSDSGVEGVVIQIGKHMSEITLQDETTIFAQAGASLAALCSFALEHELSGLEFAWGIPATVGGAIRMNAGAYGGEIKDLLVQAFHLSEAGEMGFYSDDALQFSYRNSVYCHHSHIITGGVFTLKKGNPSDIKEKMEHYLLQRKSKQPLEYPSAGSTFKRPDGAFAAQLIDECGLKGYRVGDAMVSEKHAGFVVNAGNATCLDVLQLMQNVQETVWKQTGYQLVPEVEIMQ